MSTLDSISFPELTEIEALRNSKAILLAASGLDMEALPKLYEQLKSLGRVPKLDVVLHGRGGEINAARRIALLLNKFTDHLSFIVPYHCESACTVLVLSGKEIIASDMAVFSPIDTHLNVAVGSDGDPSSLASEDVRLFTEMGKQWFGVESEEERTQLLSALASSVFPTTLTSLYRSNLEQQQISQELIAMQLPDVPEEYRNDIVEQLRCGYHSHSYALTGDDLAELGLKIVKSDAVDALSWPLATRVNRVVGGAARQNMEDPRNDFLIATTETTWIRQVHPRAFGPTWVEVSP